MMCYCSLSGVNAPKKGKINGNGAVHAKCVVHDELML